MSQHSAVEAIVAHHAEMVHSLRDRVGALVAAVDDGGDSASPAAAVTDYLSTTLIPHAAAEEAGIYPAAARTEARLVTSLLGEHEALRRLAVDLRGARTGGRRAALAGAVLELFTAHAAKENDQVLPAILEQPDSDLAGLLHGMHEELERVPESAHRH